MDANALTAFVALVAAVLGSLGGVAAMFKVQADNNNTAASAAKAVSEGAKTVIDLMNDRIDETEAHAKENTERIETLEVYVSHFDAWADRLIGILDRAITMLPDALRSQFEAESAELKVSRPKRK